MPADETDDLFTYNVTERPVPLAQARAEAPCLCMSCWGETAQVHCKIDPRNTLDNIRMLR